MPYSASLGYSPPPLSGDSLDGGLHESSMPKSVQLIACAPNWKRNACSSVTQPSWPRKSHSLTLIQLEWKISWLSERESEHTHTHRRRANVCKCRATRADWLTCGAWDRKTKIC